jgi:hypothetical protein
MSQFIRFGEPRDNSLPYIIEELKKDDMLRNRLGLQELGYFYYYLNAGLEWCKKYTTQNPELRNEYIRLCNEEINTLINIYGTKDPNGHIESWGKPKIGGRTRKRSKARGKSRSRSTLRPSKSRGKSRHKPRKHTR